VASIVPGCGTTEGDRLKVVFCVAEGDDGGIRIRSHRMPDALAVAEKAKVIRALGMRLRKTVDQGVACPQGAVPVPDWVNKGITSAREMDSNVQANLGRFHSQAPQGYIPRWSE
jgi:hypothetical protein